MHHILLMHRELPLDASDGGAWNELITSGTKFSSQRNPHSGAIRKEQFSEADIRGMADTFAQVTSWGPVAVDCNHGTLFGAVSAEDTKALGHISQVEVRDNPGGGLSLWGFIEWTEEGQRRVRAGEFRGFSAEIIPAAVAVDKATGKATGKPLLTGGTCTNSPFWPGLAPLAATEGREADVALASRKCLTDGLDVRSLSETTPPTRQENRPMKTIALPVLCSAIALTDADPSEAQVLTALGDQRRKAEAHDEAVRQGKIQATKIAALTEERDAMRSDFDAMISERVEALFTRCCTEGRLTPGKRAAFDGLMKLTEASPWADRVSAVEATWDTGRVVEFGERGDSSREADAPKGDIEDRILALAEKYEAQGDSSRVAFDRAADKLGSELGKTWGGVGLHRADA